jgi:glycosyltransferase involved in cell wall biosynthesis
MNLAITVEHRFYRTPDGGIWTPTIYAYPFWERYLEVFETACVIARAADVPVADQGWKRTDGPRVAFKAMPYYQGAKQYLMNAGKIMRALRQAVSPNDTVICRVPSQLANVLAPRLQKSGHPFALEVIGDPYEVFAPGVVHHPLRPLFRLWFSFRLRRLSKKAAALAFVTKFSLQRRYLPAEVPRVFKNGRVQTVSTASDGKAFSRRKQFAIDFSDADLKESAYSAPRKLPPAARPLTLITVASFDQLYKGQDLLIDSVAQCVREGLDLKLILIGDGLFRKEIETRAMNQGLGERASFRGYLPAGQAIRDQLDRADLFVLPSRTEGLPRALLEAMARGLPCIGSAVGGIPELLSPEDLVPKGDIGALSAEIKDVVSCPERWTRMSNRNFAKAQEYREDILREKRVIFYREIRSRTEEWQKAKGIVRNS